MTKKWIWINYYDNFKNLEIKIILEENKDIELNDVNSLIDIIN